MKMKVPKKGKDNKVKVIKKGAVTKTKTRKISKEQVLVVAQEIKYARLLSGNDKKTRETVLKRLKKWLTNCFEKGYEFKEDDFIRVWKGLFYAVWMSDKPLVQEELCESVAGILDLFPAEQFKHALLMTRAGFRTLATEWYGIDQHRMDKFLMLVRRYLRGSLRCVARCEWSVASCDKYAKMLAGTDGLFALKTPQYARNASSMILHIIDCFLEELAKVSNGSISAESVSSILRPFVTYTCLGEVPSVCAAARRLLTALLRQSEPGLAYADKTRAWQNMGCPQGGPDALELASDDEEHPEGRENGDADSDEEIDDGCEKALDPRAGRVDVEVPLLPVPARQLALSLRELLTKATAKAHKRIKICLQRFETLAAGQYPLPVQPIDSAGVVVTKPKRSIRALSALEAKLKSDTDELKLRGLSRKHRKRLLRKTRLGQSIVEDVLKVQKPHKKKPKNGEWLVESTSTEHSEKDTSNNEIKNKKKNKKSKEKTQKRKFEDTYNVDKKQNGDVASKKMKIDDKKSNKDKAKNSLDKKVKEVKIENKIKVKDTKQEVEVSSKTTKVDRKEKMKPKNEKVESPTLLINKLKNFSKQLEKDKTQKQVKYDTKKNFETPKKVKFVLKNNSMQKPLDYYKSVQQSPNIPFDSSKLPNKTNLKPSTPSPINPFFKKKLRMKHYT